MINWNLAVRKASLCKQGEGDHRKVVEGIVTRRKRDRTASFNPLSHGFAVTAPLTRASGA